jgi:hypothetical protein
VPTNATEIAKHRPWPGDADTAMPSTQGRTRAPGIDDESNDSGTRNPYIIEKDLP